MASLRQNVFFLLQLSLLLCTSITVHPLEPPHPPVGCILPYQLVYPPVQSPVHSPVQPPVYPPVNPPVQSPVNPPIVPPVYPPRGDPPRSRYVAVQGRVFCKSCKYKGPHVLTGAAPLFGAVVKLECHNPWMPVRRQTKTDRNGFFYFSPRWLPAYASHQCKVYLVSSPRRTCPVATNLNGGATGALLITTRKHPNPYVQLFTVGPFAFEPRKNFPCHYN